MSAPHPADHRAGNEIAGRGAGNAPTVMIRNIATRITNIFAERRTHPRYKHSLPIKVTFAQRACTAKLLTPQAAAFMTGETFDLSGSGISFIAPSIRVRDNYLVGEDRILFAEIDLPGGKVMMKVIGRRYERIGIHVSTERYLVGAEIVEMDPVDRERYNRFIKPGGKIVKAAAAMELGID